MGATGAPQAFSSPAGRLARKTAEAEKLLEQNCKVFTELTHMDNILNDEELNHAQKCIRIRQHLDNAMERTNMSVQGDKNDN